MNRAGRAFTSLIPLRAALIGSGLCAAALVPGLFHGGNPLAALAVLGFLVGWVLVPGLALTRIFIEEEDEDDPLRVLGFALLLGIALEGLVLLGCRVSGLGFLPFFLGPLGALAIGLLAHHRTARREPGERAVARAGEAWWFALVVLLVLVRSPIRPADELECWDRLKNDFLFHAGNAAELERSGPLLDPRVAGRALNYHVLGHALTAGASLVTQRPVLELMGTWLACFFPLVLALLVFVLARELGASSLAGLLAALALTIHSDLGVGLLQLGFKSGRDLMFGSRLDVAFYLSPPTIAGLVLLAGIGLVLARWIDPARRPGWRLAVLLALLSCAASLAKGSVMPVAIAAAFLAALIDAARTRRWPGRWLGAGVLLGVAALPGTLALALGSESYAGAMLRVIPFFSLHDVGAFEALRDPRRASGLLELALALPWCAGFLGLSGVGALVWLLAGRPSLRGLGPWILGLLVAGLGAALVLGAPGHSQLFFAYNALVLLCVVAGVGVAARSGQGRAPRLVCAALAVPFVLAGIGEALGTWRENQEQQPSHPPLWPAWLEGVRWLRSEVEPDALVVARHDALLVSAFAERRSVLELGGRYRPEFYATCWKEVDGRWELLREPEVMPFEELSAARDEVLAQDGSAALERLRELAKSSGRLYLMIDAVRIDQVGPNKYFHVEPRPRLAALERSSDLERCFENEALAIYRTRDRAASR